MSTAGPVTASHTLYVCRAEFCQSMGCEELISHLENRLGVKIGNTTADRRIDFRAIYCLGNCLRPPSAMLDGKLLDRLSTDMADVLVDALQGL